MDIQTRKIEFVQEFLKLQNEELISRFEKLLRSEAKPKRREAFQPMSVVALNQRIDQSLEDSKHGRLTQSDELVTEIKQWT